MIRASGKHQSTGYEATMKSPEKRELYDLQTPKPQLRMLLCSTAPS